jgi:hypothetical protein
MLNANKTRQSFRGEIVRSGGLGPWDRTSDPLYRWAPWVTMGTGALATEPRRQWVGTHEHDRGQALGPRPASASSHFLFRRHFATPLELARAGLLGRAQRCW